MRLRQHWRVWALWAVGAVGLAAVAFWARYNVERTIRARAEEKLRVVLEAQAVALSAWLHSQSSLLEWIAAEKRVRREIYRLVRRQNASSAQLKVMPERAELAEILEPVLHSHGLQNFAFLDTTARILTSSDSNLIGIRSEAYDAEARARLMAGKFVVVPPFIYVRYDGAGQPLRERRVGMLLATPVTDSSRSRVVGWIDLLIDADSKVFPLLQIGRFGQTGETYAINHDGVIVSPSRFEHDLRKLGLLPRDTSIHAPLVLRAADPGGDLTTGFQPAGDPSSWRPTEMAASAVQGDSGINVKGYRGYRGTPVVGAWTWLPQFDLGLATEQEYGELMTPMSIVRVVMSTLLGLLTVAALVLGVSWIQLRRSAGEARVGRQLGQYTLQRRIGEGAMGSVYRARHALLRRPTAVKLLRADRNSPQALRRFKREVQATSQLVHPNTITIYDYGSTPDGTFYYVMEYLRGLTLDAVVARFGPLHENRVAHVLRQVCGSLAEAHEAGLIHRDIKPQNIMLCHRGGVPDMVKVLDFGLVKESDDAAPQLTRDGASVGTPLYMAPEVASQSGVIDARADIYSLGVVAYYLLTGEQPFVGTNAREVMRRHIEERPVPPSEKLGRPINDVLESVVLRCLAKLPGSRPQSARELESMLSDVIVPSLDPWTEIEADAWWRDHLPNLIGVEEDTPVPERHETLADEIQGRTGVH